MSLNPSAVKSFDERRKLIDNTACDESVSYELWKLWHTEPLISCSAVADELEGILIQMGDDVKDVNELKSFKQAWALLRTLRGQKEGQQ